MARQAKTTGTAVATWDEELAKHAQQFADSEASTATGQFFSLAGGVLKFNDAPLPNNEMVAIVIDSILENVYYEDGYDPDNPASPICFAFGRDEKTMAPHELVVEASNQQCGTSGLCSGCEMNEWGTADKGRGKACRNTRRLALISAGTIKDGRFTAFDEEEHFETGAIAFMKLPVTSVKGYAAYVKQLAGALKKPPFAVYTKIKLVPDPKTQFKVTFEPLGEVPVEFIGTLLKRHEEAKSVIDFPYTPRGDQEEKPQRRGAKAQKPAPRGRKY